MNGYSFEELADMHVAFGAAEGVVQIARRYYAERFPNRRQPSNNLIASIDRRLRETGSMIPNMANAGRPRSVRTPELEEMILDFVENTPSISTRQIGRQLGVDHTLVWDVLNESGMYPYHIQKVQSLKNQDFARRVGFCDWALAQRQHYPNFPNSVLFTDEATFTNNGVFNCHNTHRWAYENPNYSFETGFQERISVNVWAGVLGDALVGPFILPPRLNGVNYLNFLQEDLPGLIADQYPDWIEQHHILDWYQQDGAPAHWRVIVREYLDATFPDRWIGRGGPQPWPPRSPDMTPCDFCVWGFFKNRVYATTVTTEENLIQRIFEAAEAFRATPGIFEAMRRSFLRRCQLCVEVGGQNFEHLL